MYTQCPKCLTYFQVTAEHLKVAQGNVRCGQCSNVFSALGNLSEVPPQDNKTGAKTGGQQPSPADAAGDGNAQSKLTNAIAAIQALNQSSQKILSQGRKNYVTQLQKQAQEQRKGSPTAKTNSAGIAENEEGNIDIEEALAAVDGLEDDITPTDDVSHLVEDYKTQDPQEDSTESPRKRRSKILKSDDIEIEDDDDVFDFSELDLPDDDLDEPVTRKKTKTKKQSKAKKKKAAKKKAVKKKATKKKISKREKDSKPAQASPAPAPTPPPAPEPESTVNIPQNIISDPDVIIENDIPTLAIPKALLEDFEQQEKVSHVDYRSMLTWGSLSVLMMLLFLGQTIYFKHNELGQISSLRPWVQMFCKHASCELSMQADIAQIELLGQDIRSHPKNKKALLVSATIINNASFTQPYPGLQLSFSDINGEKVATRNFMPKDYLSPKLASRKGMESNIPIQLELELVDPGKNAVNFEFDFFSI